MKIHKEEKNIMQVRKVGGQEIRAEQVTIRNKGRFSSREDVSTTPHGMINNDGMTRAKKQVRGNTEKTSGNTYREMGRSQEYRAMGNKNGSKTTDTNETYFTKRTNPRFGSEQEKGVGHTDRKIVIGNNKYHKTDSTTARSNNRFRSEKNNNYIHKREPQKHREFGGVKNAVRSGKDYTLNGSGEAGKTTNKAVDYGIETPARTGKQAYGLTKKGIEEIKIHKANRALKRELREKENRLYEEFAAGRGDKTAIRKLRKRVKKTARAEYRTNRLKSKRGGFFKGAISSARSRLTGKLRGKLFQSNKGEDAAGRSSTQLISFGGGVLGRSGSLIMRLILHRFRRRFLFGLIGLAAAMVLIFAVPFAIVATPFGIFFYQGRSESEAKNPEDVLREFFNNKGTEIQQVAAKGKRTVTEKVPKEITEEVTDENGEKKTVTKTVYESKTTTTNIVSDIIYDYTGAGNSNFYDILATFSVLYGRREGGFSNWEEDGNNEPQIDENGNLVLTGSSTGTILMGKLMTTSIKYKTETRTITEGDRKEEYTVVVVTLKSWEEIVNDLPNLTWSGNTKDYYYPPDSSEEVKKTNKFQGLTEEERSQLKEIFEELRKNEDAPMLPGTFSGYGDIVGGDTTIDDGSATAIQLTIANNARNNNGNFPATYGWCAAWVGGIYGRSGRPTPHGDAKEYWYKWGSSGSNRKDNIPIGAAVVTGPTSSNQYGHIGIYIGNGLIASNLGGVKIESVQSFSDGRYGPWLGWCWPDGIALGPTPNPDSAGWKKGIASAYGGWSDAQIADNARTATGEAVTETSMGVAIPMAWANFRSYYGHKVLIRYNGKTVTATINDCGAMDGGNRALDLQPGVFKAFGATSCNSWGLREVEYKIL